ncbi:ABC transporter substrate-binding protein [Quadrisphaera setariae]|uniref:ABC transporter substrate-binding protein n=1 Tax=Quadrisphaera setariae TaxID=2593304 RepID=A0A5C8ZFL9_9ACTN|nr:ABC transporter substrate-binding protein [Quadrisphaera setariae]TXR56835.1 ABC transporter substrate-binding protein [Quadrisphaera setariae]
MVSSPPRRRPRARLLTGAALAAAALLAGCTAQAPAGSGSGSGTSGAARPLNVAFNVAPTTIDPASGCTLDDARLTMALYVQLLQPGQTKDADGVPSFDPTKAEPYFAKSYDVSSDGLTYTFHLQDGWTFPSGEPMDAEAVKYSLDRTTAIGGCGSAIINDLYLSPTLIKQVTATDATTVTVELSTPDPDFPLALATPAGSIVDPSVVEANGGTTAGKPNEWMASHEAGSGPFRLKSFEPGTKAVLERDPDFKGEAPASQTINVSWVKTDSAMLLQAQNGELDVAQGLSKSSAKSLEGSADTQVIASTATANMQMLMPNDKAPWDNAKLREAVTYAIPYQDILDNVLKGYGQLYYGPVPPSMPGYDASVAGARTYDLAKAEQLMSEAGVSGPVEVTLDTISGDTNQAAIATILQGSLKEIGITVNVNPLSESAWGEAVYGRTAQAALRLDGPAVFNAGYYLSYDERCGIEYNTGVICVPGNAALLDTVRSSSDEAARTAALDQLQANWVAASPKAILYLDKTAVAVKKGTTYLWNPITDMRTWKAA